MNSHFSNNIYPVQFEGPVKFKRASLFDSTRLCSFDVKHPKFDQINVTTSKQKSNKYSINVSSPDKLYLSKEDFYIFPQKQELYESNIKTCARYRKQSLGEIAKITSIITMLQNNLNKIKIFSLGDAVIFHHKYKFEPNITERPEAIRVLKQIMQSKFKEYHDQAQIILIKSINPNQDSSEFLGMANKFTKQFLDDIITNKKYDNKTFQYWTLDMTLTKENIMNNKFFFNNILKKHGIDFQI